MRPARAALAGLLLVGAIPVGATLAGSEPAAAAPSESSRKAAHRTVPAHASRSAPDVTGTVSKPHPDNAAVAPPPPPPDDEVIPPPFKLPTASRDRVRACGLVWHDMKIAGKTGDDDWRDFASKCFVAKDPPTMP